MTMQELTDIVESTLEKKGAYWSMPGITTQLNTTTVVGTSSGSYDFYDQKPNFCEFELEDGTTMIFEISKSKIHTISSFSKTKIQWSSKFPFIKLQKQNYTKFTYYGENKSETFVVKVSLPKFMELLNVLYKSSSEIQLDDIIRNG